MEFSGIHSLTTHDVTSARLVVPTRLAEFGLARCSPVSCSSLGSVVCLLQSVLASSRCGEWWSRRRDSLLQWRAVPTRLVRGPSWSEAVDFGVRWSRILQIPHHGLEKCTDPPATLCRAAQHPLVDQRSDHLYGRLCQATRFGFGCQMCAMDLGRSRLVVDDTRHVVAAPAIGLRAESSRS